MKTIREIFKHNISKLIGNRSLKEIAAGMGIPYRSFQNIKDGVIPQDETMKKIADYFGVSEGALFLDPDLLPAPEPTLSEQVTELAKQIAKEAIEEFQKASVPQLRHPGVEYLPIPPDISPERRVFLDLVAQKMFSEESIQAGPF